MTPNTWLCNAMHPPDAERGTKAIDQTTPPFVEIDGILVELRSVTDPREITAMLNTYQNEMLYRRPFSLPPNNRADPHQPEGVLIAQIGGLERFKAACAAATPATPGNDTSGSPTPW